MHTTHPHTSPLFETEGLFLLYQNENLVLIDVSSSEITE